MAGSTCPSSARSWPPTNQLLVSISGAQRRPVDDLRLNWVATVHHGLDLATTYQLGTGDGGHLVFLGRISAEKDPATAIRVAIGASLPLHIAARVDPVDQPFFESQVRPLLHHPPVHWHGEVDDAAKGELVGRATAMLVPIDWEEPFGLAFIEALACGTPVVSRPASTAPLAAPGHSSASRRSGWSPTTSVSTRRSWRARSR
jgi:glycosyltransferase involved in cell wall biosynthesis